MAVSDVNVLVVTGRVGTDLEHRDAGNHRLTRWRFAVTEVFGERENTYWLTAQVWNREGVASFISKGDMLTLTGRLKIDDYENRDGEPRREIIIDVDMIRKGGASGDVARRQEPAGKPGGAEEDELPW